MILRAVDVPLSDGGGWIQRYQRFPSAHVEPRTVDVWLPPDCANGDQRHPVLYMHDGHNLFDPALSTTGQDWGVDEAVSRLLQNRQIPKGVVVVGIWHGANRWREYMPAKPLAQPNAQAVRDGFIREHGGAPISDDYLLFLTTELKPFIDSAYPTLPDSRHTFVAGSSMGGLVSLYALAEYPEVFGGAACLSTHWPAGGMVLVDYFTAALPRAGLHRIYFDYGTEGLDAEYEPYQKAMDKGMRALGYTGGVDWVTRKFVGADHNEAAWRARLDIPLQFLLGR
ncbi:MAG: alpha/beta hydrolase-fold protein [Anaerolineae bacterium]|nr:alpha/beta hydrolase-fold protein [Anaerolineae bacterium]